MKHLLAIMAILLSANLFAQENKVIERIDKKQKIQEWTVDGKEAQKILKDLGVDRDFSDMSSDEEVEIIRIERGSPKMFFMRGDKFDLDMEDFDLDMEDFELDMEKLGMDLEKLDLDLDDLDIDLEELHDGNMMKHFKFKLDNDGEVQEFEWNGEGDMPDELKLQMEELKDRIKDLNFEEIEIHKLRPGHHRMEFDHNKRIEMHGPENKAFLGIMSAKVEGQKGVVINKVISETPAEKAGLQKGDNIISIDGQKVESTADVLHAIGEKNPGDEIKIDYIRDGKSMTTKAALMENKHHAKSRKEMKHNHRSNMKHHIMKRRAKAHLGVQFGEEDNLVIDKVVEGSPAEKAGFKAGDQILGLDATSVAKFESLIEVLREKKPGDVVEIKVLRDGKEQTLETTLGERKREKRMHHKMHNGGGDEEIIIIRKKKSDKTDSEIRSDRDVELEIFPNPSEGTMKINLRGSESPATIRVYDNSGKEYYNNTLTPIGTSIEETIQLDGTPSGLLFLHIEQDGVVTTEKIMLQE